MINTKKALNLRPNDKRIEKDTENWEILISGE